MKFYGKPNEQVNVRQRIGFSFKTVPLCQFNEKGEFETEDKGLIELLKTQFKYKEIKKHKCKKCGEEFENKGQLLAHYRHHKKR